MAWIVINSKIAKRLQVMPSISTRFDRKAAGFDRSSWFRTSRFDPRLCLTCGRWRSRRFGASLVISAAHTKKAGKLGGEPRGRSES